MIESMRKTWLKTIYSRPPQLQDDGDFLREKKGGGEEFFGRKKGAKIF